MEALIEALSGLEGKDPNKVVATPDWAFSEYHDLVHRLACEHCLTQHHDKIVVEPNAIKVLRKYGYDIRILRDAHHVISVALHTRSGIFVLRCNQDLVKAVVGVHKQLINISWWKKFLGYLD